MCTLALKCVGVFLRTSCSYFFLLSKFAILVQNSQSIISKLDSIACDCFTLCLKLIFSILLCVLKFVCMFMFAFLYIYIEREIESYVNKVNFK